MLVYFIIAPILMGIFLYLCPLKRVGKALTVAVHSAMFALAVYVFFECRDAEIVERVGNFEHLLGITLRADPLSSPFILLAAFIFMIASIYSFTESDSPLFRFLLSVWEGLLLGVLLTGDMFSIFVLLEVVTLTVAVLIMYKRDNRSMYDGIFYLMTNTVAMMFFLLGAGYVYKLTGTFDISASAAALSGLDRESQLLPMALIMTAICLKCGLMPLYSWLPKAHGTPGSPSSVSAILSGLHIKGGIYLFLRFSDMFSQVIVTEVFLVIGFITGVLGFTFALAQTDIKLILAYSTISQIGIIMIGFNYDSTYSYTGALYHVFNHALFKSALFLCAGAITQAYGTRDIRKICGVFRRMPIVGATIVMAVLGIAGAPFFNGSISKYFIASNTDWLTNSAILFINLGTITTFIKFSSILRKAAGDGSETEAPAHEKIGAPKTISILILGTLCLLGGIFGEPAVAFLFNVEMQVDAIGYLEKTAYFFASLAAGYFICKYYVPRSRILLRFGKFDMGFRATCAALGGFFGAILIAGGIFAR